MLTYKMSLLFERPFMKGYNSYTVDVTPSNYTEDPKADKIAVNTTLTYYHLLKIFRGTTGISYP